MINFVLQLIVCALLLVTGRAKAQTVLGGGVQSNVPLLEENHNG
jgi:hypothetical protein